MVVVPVHSAAMSLDDATTGGSRATRLQALYPAAAKFIVVGLVNNAVTFGGFVFLSLLGMGAFVAMTITYAVGLAITFTGNRNWSFRHKGGVASSTVRFLSVYGVGYFLNLLVLWALIRLGGLSQIPAQLIAIIVLAVFTFVLMRLWVFKASAS